jgi:putative ABC transport system permease protein
MLIEIGQGIIERGLIYSIVVIGIYLTSRVIKFDDLTVEGSFGIGGAMMTFLLIHRINPWICLCGALIAGALSGVATAVLHTKLKLNNLISGIVVTTALFSITLKLGGANQTLTGINSIFDLALPAASLKFLCILLPVCLVTLYAMRWLLNTQVGFMLKALGDSPQMITNIGKRADRYTILALALSNMLTALAGALFVQYVGYFSIWAGVGTLIIALAGLMLAEVFDQYLGIALIIGAILYQIVIAATFEFQLDPELNKLVTALLIIGLLLLKKKTSTAVER